jgi:hypothetical protein
MAAGQMCSAEVDPELCDTPCAVCKEPIIEGDRYYQRNGWKLLGHMICVLGNPDAWDSLPDINH